MANEKEFDGLDEHEDDWEYEMVDRCGGCDMITEVDYSGLCIYCYKDFTEYIH